MSNDRVGDGELWQTASLTLAFIDRLMSLRKTLLFSHPSCERHENGAAHPECPERIEAIRGRLIAEGLMARLEKREPGLATREQLLLAHPARLVDAVFQSAPERGRVQLDADTSMNPYTLEASRRAVAAGIEAVDAVLDGEAINAFCMVRPPGHHAERLQSMGFCIFSSIAIAALHARRSRGLERVAIVDFDVHHGNGTEDVLDGIEGILFCSSFQHPFYPGYFKPNVPDQRVNVPLPAGTGSPGFRAEVGEKILTAVDAFRPELILVSAGFDAHVEDPLASLDLIDNDFKWVSDKLTALAEKHCEGRLVSMLEGGYALPALARSAALHVQSLITSASSSGPR